MSSEWSRRNVYRARTMRRRRRLLPILAVLAAVAIGVAVAHGQGGGGRVVYDRAAAAAYADKWALGANPAYWRSPDHDCANFVSQCVAAGGLQPLNGPAGDWQDKGTAFPSTGWVNCDAQQRVWSEPAGDALSPYIVASSTSLPKDWAVGDVVYLGNVTDGTAEWQHVIICVGKTDGHWLYDSHTVAHRRQPMSHLVPRPLLADPLLPAGGRGGVSVEAASHPAERHFVRLRVSACSCAPQPIQCPRGRSGGRPVGAHADRAQRIGYARQADRSGHPRARLDRRPDPPRGDRRRHRDHRRQAASSRPRAASTTPCASRSTPDDAARRRGAHRGQGREHLPPGHGLEQAKLYAASKRLNVPFVFASNGHLFVEYDRFTGLTHAPAPAGRVPDARTTCAPRYEAGHGLLRWTTRPPRRCCSATPAARRRGATTRTPPSAPCWRRSRAASERASPSAPCSRSPPARARPSSPSTCSSASPTPASSRRALFVCDRDELRSQGAGAFQNVFGADAAAGHRRQPAEERPHPHRHLPDARRGHRRRRRQLPARQLPRELLQPHRHRRVPPLGLGQVVAGAHPQPERRADRPHRHAAPAPVVTEKTKEALRRRSRSTPTTSRYFGEPVYEYDMSQGIEDGYLAACEIVRRRRLPRRQARCERGHRRRPARTWPASSSPTPSPASRSTSTRRATHYDADELRGRCCSCPSACRRCARDLFAHLLDDRRPGAEDDHLLRPRPPRRRRRHRA